MSSVPAEKYADDEYLVVIDALDEAGHALAHALDTVQMVGLDEELTAEVAWVLSQLNETAIKRLGHVIDAARGV